MNSYAKLDIAISSLWLQQNFIAHNNQKWSGGGNLDLVYNIETGNVSGVDGLLQEP